MELHYRVVLINSLCAATQITVVGVRFMWTRVQGELSRRRAITTIMVEGRLNNIQGSTSCMLGNVNGFL